MDRYLPLAKAAAQLGLSRRTLRRDLEKLGVVFGRAGRGTQRLVSERLLAQVIARRAGTSDWAERKAS
jgi:hypothetical protein